MKEKPSESEKNTEAKILTHQIESIVTSTVNEVANATPERLREMGFSRGEIDEDEDGGNRDDD